MSARDHDLEQSHAADDLTTSTPSTPSPRRRDPEEDADANFTRKRPRLDQNGGASLRAMSTDSDSPSKALTSPHKEMVAMTIREQAAVSPSPEEDDARDPSSPSRSRASTPTTLPVMVDGAGDDPKSPPVIEIVDDEDEDDLVAKFTVQPDAEAYFRQFPYHGTFRNALEALREITNHIQKSKCRKSLREIARTSAYTTQIWTFPTTSFRCWPSGSKTSPKTPRPICSRSTYPRRSSGSTLGTW